MSYSVDVNLLVYASDESSRHHPRASEFLARCASDPDLFLLSWTTIMSYLRIATHPRIFNRPLSPATALKNVEGLLALPRVHAIAEEASFLDAYRVTTREFAARGNRVPDAHLATLLQQHGVKTLYAADRDFKRFDFLDVRNPL